VSVVARRPDLRFPFPPDFAARLTGRRVVAVSRRAKYLLFTLDDDQVLLGHLGMSGALQVTGPDTPLLKHDHIEFVTDHGDRVRYNDPRRFGFFDLTTVADLDDHPMIAPLGPEPLGNGFNAAVLSAALRGRRTPIKAALLDQRIVAGLGNIYVCEALYYSNLSPRRVARTVPGKRAERLVRAVREVLNAAIAAGGSTLRDFRQADGALGYFQTSHAAYGREGEPCRRCAETGTPATIRRIVQSGRSTFYCPRHQR
jgi:formamidopyrimidine-DNA glycosylase